MILNDFIMKINLKTLLIIKRMINLSVDVNENKKIIILLLSVSSDYLIINFKSNAFKTITVFNGIFFEIEMKLNKLLIFFSIITYLF